MALSASGGAVRDFALDTAFNLIPGYTRVASLGNNPDIDVAPEDIWSDGGLYPWMSAATSLEIVSSSANDTAAGTGARTVRIEGLDGAFAAVNQTVTLNGTTPVAIPTQLMRINRAVMITGGSAMTNAGNITIRDSGGGTTRAVLPAGFGITRQSQYTTPLGFTLQVVSMVFSINRPSTTRDAAVATYIGNQTASTYVLGVELSVDGNTYRHDGMPGFSIAEKTDFGLRCTYASATNTDLTAGWLGVLRDNSAV